MKIKHMLKYAFRIRCRSVLGSDAFEQGKPGKKVYCDRLRFHWGNHNARDGTNEYAWTTNERTHRRAQRMIYVLLFGVMVLCVLTGIVLLVKR